MTINRGPRSAQSEISRFGIRFAQSPQYDAADSVFYGLLVNKKRPLVENDAINNDYIDYICTAKCDKQKHNN